MHFLTMNVFHHSRNVRQRELKADQEKDMVEQAKLVKIKDQRAPKLADVHMYPPITGKKCMGTLEAHQNGLRFTSTKGETLDVMYNNIKHVIYQPCDGTHKVRTMQNLLSDDCMI